MRNKPTDSFALDLSSLIIHLEYQRKRVVENPYTRERMCYCRSVILERYTATLQKFLVRLSARTLKFFDDYDYEITTDMSDLQDWFYAEIYDILYEDPDVSNKMVLLFRIVQKNLDKRFFDLIDKKYRAMIREQGENNINEFTDILDGLYAEVRSWFEVFVYNILAVQLNCDNLNDQIFKDFMVPVDRNCKSKKGSDICETCQFAACRTCHVHPEVLKGGENITIVMTDEFTECPRWMDNLLDTVEKYHDSPKEISFSFDFRMYDHNNKFYFSRNVKDQLMRADEVMGKVHITNYSGVEFAHFRHCIEKFLNGKKDK